MILLGIFLWALFSGHFFVAVCIMAHWAFDAK